MSSSTSYYYQQPQTTYSSTTYTTSPESYASRPQPQVDPTSYSRSSTSSDSSLSSDSSVSSTSSTSSTSKRLSISMDYLQQQSRVEVMRCSRCAKCVETISTVQYQGNELRRVSTDDASASGMVRFGHNLYYCDRCARMVGYK